MPSQDGLLPLAWSELKLQAAMHAAAKGSWSHLQATSPPLPAWRVLWLRALSGAPLPTRKSQLQQHRARLPVRCIRTCAEMQNCSGVSMSLKTTAAPSKWIKSDRPSADFDWAPMYSDICIGSRALGGDMRQTAPPEGRAAGAHGGSRG